MKLLQRAAIAILALIAFQFAQAQEPTNRYPLIPYPVSLQPASGEFVITAQTALVFDAAFTNEAEQLQMSERSRLKGPTLFDGVD